MVLSLQDLVAQMECNKGRYVFYWGGWAGALEGRVISKYFSKIGEGQTCLIRSRGRVTVFLARKILLHVG